MVDPRRSAPQRFSRSHHNERRPLPVHHVVQPRPESHCNSRGLALFLFGWFWVFLVGPLLVPAPNDTKLAAAVSNGAIRDKIQLVMYAELAAIAVLFAAILLYFPSRPPVPPSVAAASQRLSYRSSICRLLSNLRFLMIALAYAVPTGVISGWSGVLDMILTPANVSQDFCCGELKLKQHEEQLLKSLQADFEKCQNAS
ncbi:hypothetical protein fugu_000651 [Takifugu bimaculatus]|uniref:Uncharacterized protein n=1 Tax=Takifugu bimaculatus TaxID=433685 RepID=A0A4Z2CHB9_9TELE|nr:hypothetical protein fugu_000651 [Takifugu bimaculatus]